MKYGSIGGNKNDALLSLKIFSEDPIPIFFYHQDAKPAYLHFLHYLNKSMSLINFPPGFPFHEFICTRGFAPSFLGGVDMDRKGIQAQ